MARKFGLGRGLSALIPEEDFPTEKQNEAVEAGIDVRSDIDIDIDVVTDIEPPAEQSETIVPAETSVTEETSAEISTPDMSDGLSTDDLSLLAVSDMASDGLSADDLSPLAVSDVASDDVPVSDMASDDVPAGDLSPLAVSDVASDDVPVSDMASDDVPAGDLSPLAVSDVASDDVPVSDMASDDVPTDDVPPQAVSDVLAGDIASDDLSVDDLPLDDLSLDDVPVNDVVANDSADKGARLANDLVVQLAIDRLVPNPGQPRKNFDETELQELADSIKEHGVIMPIIAADTGDEHYTIIAGERRTRAARLAGLEEVPVIIRNYTDQKRMEISLIENIQRSDLNPIEEATAYKNLMDFSSLSHEELAARVGKNRSTVTNALRLLKLSAEVQKSLETGELSAGHARALLSVTDDKLRDKLFKEITVKGLSVREAEKKASALNTAGEAVEDGDAASGLAKEKVKRPPEITEMEEKFIEKLGTKVSIAGGLEKGLIRIEYYSMEDLDRLYGLLGG